MNKLKSLFEVDLRSMALFRVAMGTLLLCDLYTRSLWLKAHYTDFGIAPRKLLLDGILHDFRFSFHLFNGQVEFQAVMFFISFVFTLCYLLGYKTKLSAFITWILLLSIQNRNNMILNAGDVITRMMLFWSIFMPLSKVYSIDAALNKNNKIEDKNFIHFSWAGVFFLLQLCFMYWFSIYHKSTHYWRPPFMAVYYSLHIDQYATHFGAWLRQFVGLTQGMTAYTVFIEIVGPILAIFPFKKYGWIRFIGVVLMINLHFGLFLTFNLGTFPWICMAAWLAFIPPVFWEKLEQWFKKPLQTKAAIYADRDCNFCLKLVAFIKAFFILPSVDLKVAQNHPEIEELQIQENSWVVVTESGDRKLHFEAFIYLVGLSPLLFWSKPLLSFSPIKILGTISYKIVASNRQRFSVLTRYIKNPSQYVRPGKITNIFLSFVFTFVVLHMLSNMKTGIKLPNSVKNFGRAFSFMQHWNMFRNPKKNDGWFVIRGKLLNGKDVNPWTMKYERTSSKKPKLVADQFPTNRWRKYLMKTMAGDEEKLLYFGKYLCRRWNTSHRGNKRLEKFKVYFYRERTQPPGEKFSVKKKRIWSHRCGVKKKS